MTCRDRTGEFLTAMKSLQSRQTNGYKKTGPYHEQNYVVKQSSPFTLLSRHIGKDISKTFNKLEKLAKLSKRKSLFDDKPVEIQELTYIIKQLVDRCNSQKSKNEQTHSRTVVMSLQNMKHQKSRREQFSQGAVAENLPEVAMASSGASLQLRSTSTPNHQHNDSVRLDVDRASGVQSQILVEERGEYLKYRASAMESIEQTIVELGGIFQQLAHLVSEQEEQIKRIDMNVEETELNVEAAHSELLKYFQSISSNRWLIIKIFFVLIIFFIVFVVFMV